MKSRKADECTSFIRFLWVFFNRFSLFLIGTTGLAAHRYVVVNVYCERNCCYNDCQYHH